LNLRAVAFDVGSRMVIVRDRVSRARIARSLLEALLLPRAQVSIEVQLLTLDSDRSYHYGVSLPTTFRLLDFGHIGALRTILSSVTNPMNFLAFGGGATLFGVGLTDATIFATYSKSFTNNLYNAIVTVGNGQTASLHVGDKFPIPQSLNTGFQQAGGSIYNPIGEVTLEDLGLVLKLTPHVNGDGDVGLDLEAEYKALGTQTINTVPSISQRRFKGNVMLREGQWAVLAGIDENTRTVTRNGLAGVAQIPGLNQVLSENARDDKAEHTLLVIKPTITRLPMSGLTSPQYLLGPIGGARVLL
jgi:general secretion pathway protein D